MRLAGGRRRSRSCAPRRLRLRAGTGRPPSRCHRAVIAGALIGVLGGTIGLGGAEFRLPLLIGVFGFVALQAVIMNKAMSLMSVRTALSARLFSVQWSDVAPH